MILNKLKLKTFQGRGLVFLLVRMGLGLAFITAAWPKIMDPAGFAKILYGYDLFPGVSINLLALWVPWVELLAGFCLLTGMWAGPGLVVINTLLISFIAMISFNLARGHSFDCGCFSVGAATKPRMRFGCW